MNYTWDNSFSVGNDTIDNQHRQLLDLFNETYNLLNKPDKNHKLVELMSDLVVYTVFHFSEEEKLMTQAQYEHLNAHKQKHHYFIEEIKTFKAQISKDPEAVTEELFLFLADWIVTHIKEEDQAYKSII